MESLRNEALSASPRGCLTSLVDLSFTEFLTTKIIKWLYIILLALVGIGLVVALLGGLVTMFTQSFFSGLLIIIGAPIVAILYAMIARVWMELIIVIFRIAENTTEMARQGRAPRL